MIIHQTQPTYNSCVVTCLAMLAGKKAEEVVAKHHHRYWESPPSIISIMEDLDIVAVPVGHGSPICWGHVYLLCMPSLNNPNGTHQIIVDLNNNSVAVFDPACGRIKQDGKKAKFYTEDTFLEPSWYPEWRILDCPAFRS